MCEEYTYATKIGKEVKRKRTIRKQFDELFIVFKTSFDNKCTMYLIHRYQCINDTFLWQQILDNSKLSYVIHMDYSENISCTPKI